MAHSRQKYIFNVGLALGAFLLTIYVLCRNHVAYLFTRDYELGREQDLSKVMINQQVSSLGFQLTLNIRNKVMTAYKDIMNMPV